MKSKLTKDNTVDVSEVLDFLYCPLLTKIKTGNVNIKDAYEKIMKDFITSYHSILDIKGAIDIKDVKRIFASSFMEKDKNKYIYTDSGDYRNTYQNLRKKGIDSVINFHKFALSKESYKPIASGYPFFFPVGEGVFLKGKIDLIVQINEKIHLICFKGLSNLYRKESIYFDIEVVSMLKAFEYIFNKKPDVVEVYFLDKNKLAFIDQSKVDKNFCNSILNIKKSIKNNILYRANFDRCYKCKCYNECYNDDFN